ncbi:hypothetical protein KIPB_016238, partial [Kipferlia bialata]
LTLNSNFIGDTGATALAQALPSLTGLTSLNLFDNSIGDTGATSLAQALSSVTGLTRVSATS